MYLLRQKEKRMLPKVSVIIPIYNVEIFLTRCVESVLKQTMKELEIILVNDGSTDNSPRLCDKFKLEDSRIKVIHKKMVVWHQHVMQD